jgi:hypothetical protein
VGLSRDNLTTIANRTGCRVVAAWSTRNAGTMGEVYGVVMHHTGTANSAAIAPTLGIVQNGRSDLQNALCNYYIDRAGTIYLITEKVAWHAGAGSWRGLTDGNGHLLGIEPESDGRTWTAATVESYVRLVAEICRFLGADPHLWAIRHGQWAPTRKVDFSGLDEADFRRRVDARLAGRPLPQEDDMPLSAEDIEKIKHAVAEAPIGGTLIGGGRDVMLWQLLGRLDTDLRRGQILSAAATPPAPQPVQVDAAAVAAALAGNGAFLSSLAKAVNDDASARLSA